MLTALYRMVDNQTDLLRQTIKPLARLAVKRTLAFSSIAELLKEEMVQAAVAELEAQQHKVTVSRVSLLTGITRREIQRILTAGKSAEARPSLLSRVLSTWEHDARFLTKDRKPRLLSTSGARNEFKELCEAVSQDVNSGTVLRELKRLGAVEETARGVKLLTRVEYLHTSPERGTNMLIKDIEFLSAAAQENIYAPQETRNLHMRTEYDNLFKDKLPEIRAWLLDHGSRLHREAREYLAAFDKDINPDPAREGGGHAVLGAFSLTNR